MFYIYMAEKFLDLADAVYFAFLYFNTVNFFMFR